MGRFMRRSLRGDKRRFEEISSTTPEVSTTPTPPYQGGELNKGGKTK